MALRWLVRANTYHDSIKLMRISEALGALEGVERAAAVMATPLNCELLADDGLLPPDLQASPDDLLVAVLGEDEAAAEHALAQLDGLLQVRDTGSEAAVGPRFRSFAQIPPGEADRLALIAVPGANAAAEAFAALHAGLHVFLFSDNVSLQDEVRLKRLAAERDLLMMGPDCGTAILGGVGLGFANRVRPGPVGIVGASGTGIQQVCCLLDQAGIGVAAAIGTGGRDLSSAVGASMTRRALAMLKSDPAVNVVVVISKPADPRVAERLHKHLLKLRKPSVACLLGTPGQDEGSVHYAANLSEAAHLTVQLLGEPYEAPDEPATGGGRRGRRSGQVYGLFAGGTLCTEAEQTLAAMDAPHTLLDLGADEYTQGRAHPMIDPRLRASMLAGLAAREDVGAVLLDVILGDLAHPDPAGALLPALDELRAARATPAPVFVTLIGTRQDPQDWDAQCARLQGAGARVFTSNVAAAVAAGAVLGGAA